MACVVSSNPSLSDEVEISWSLAFSDRVRTAADAARRARTFADLPIVEQDRLELPHRIRGRNVGTIVASYVLAATRQEYGWAELGLGIPLTRGVFAAARFWSTGPSFACTVGGTASKHLHRDAAVTAA